jgi:hypothetical protein
MTGDRELPRERAIAVESGKVLAIFLGGKV